MIDACVIPTEYLVSARPSSMREVRAQRDIPCPWGTIAKGTVGFMKRPSVAFVPIVAGPDDVTLGYEFDYDPDTVRDWWDEKVPA